METNPDMFLFEQGVVNEKTLEIARIKLAQCYEAIVKVLEYYLDLPDPYYKLLAIWIIAGYSIEQFETFAILYFNAIRGGGKTRLSKLVNILSNGGNGSIINSITEAVLFRHPRGVIMSIDEIESLGNKEKMALRELLNSVYKKGTEVKRMRKSIVNKAEMQVTETFKPYFPVTLANINGIEEVLESRAITLTLEKSPDKSKTKLIENYSDLTLIQDIKRTLSKLVTFSDVTLRNKNYIRAWNDWIKERYCKDIVIKSLTTLTSLNDISHYSEKIEEYKKAKLDDIERDEFFLKIDSSGIDSRHLELFFPLLITAKLIHDEVFEEILSISKELVKNKKEDEYAENKDVSLYQFIAETQQPSQYISLKEMCSHFRLFVGDTGLEESWLNERWLGKALKRLSLAKSKKKMASGRFVILDVEKAKEKIKMFRGESNE